MKRKRSNLWRRRVNHVRLFAAGTALGAGLAFAVLLLSVRVFPGVSLVVATPGGKPKAPAPSRSVDLVAPDTAEYCRRAALAALARQRHEIVGAEVRFIRDPEKPGSAVQQFCNVFGEMIQETVSTLLVADKGEGLLVSP